MRTTTIVTVSMFAGLILGIYLRDIAQDFRNNRQHSMCHDTKGYEAYVAVKDDLEHCFKIHRETGKVSRSAISIDYN